MTAINPARLKMQTAALSEHYRDPDLFRLELHKLLDFYADRVRRSGRSGHPPPTLPAYRVPRPVLSQIIRELKAPLERHPSRGLLLADELWNEEWLETRFLAGALLGIIPPINPEPLFKRIKTWALENQERAVLEGLIHRGLAGLYQKYPERVEALTAELNAGEGSEGARAALTGLEMLINQPAFANLPFVYQELSQRLRRDPEPRRELISLLKKLIQVSERETLFFLQKHLKSEPSREMERIVRRCLPVFSEEHQTELRQLLRKNR